MHSWKSGKCQRGHDVTDPTNVGHSSSGRYCRECERVRLVKRNRGYRDATADRHRAIEPDRRHAKGHGDGAMVWRVTGRCKRGHDITGPGDVFDDDGKRTCRACVLDRRRERYHAAKRAGNEAQVAAVKTPQPTQPPSSRKITPIELNKILDLYRRAEDAPTWRKAELRALAESIREHGLPSDLNRERGRGVEKRVKARQASLDRAGRHRGGDGGTDAIDAAAAVSGECRNGAAVGATDAALAQHSERDHRDSGVAGDDLQRDTGPGKVKQIV